jgi:hypothetical protein
MSSILTPTEEFILNTLHGEGEIQSLFQFATENRMAYPNTLMAVNHLAQMDLVVIQKHKNLPGRPLTIKLRKARILSELKTALANLEE